MSDYELISKIEEIINNNIELIDYQGYNIDKSTMTDEIFKLIKEL